MTRPAPLLACALALVPVAPAVRAAPADPEAHDCLIEPYRKVELRSPVEALIARIAVERGDRVRSGDTLVELQSDAERAALDAARYRAGMQGEIQVAGARLQYARDKSGRLETLGEQKFVSVEEREAALAELRVAEAELVRVTDDARLAAIDAERLAAVLALRTLTAPFAGVVTERLQNPGELAFTGEGARPILKLAQTDPLRVEIVLPVALYGRIALGLIGEVAPESPLAGRWPATVTVVDPVLDAASGTFGVRMALPNPKGDIPAGIRCRVRFAPSDKPPG
jgi:RND family efflux transporter MFP subunit